MCTICKKRFTRSDLLNRHRRIHPVDAASSGPPKSVVSPIPSSVASASVDDVLRNVINSDQVKLSIEHDENSYQTQDLNARYSHEPHQATQHNSTPNSLFLRHLLSQAQLSNPLAGTPPPQGLTRLAEAAVPSSTEPVASNPVSGNVWDDGLFMGLGNQAGYMGTYDADISWTFDNFNAESSSNNSADYDMCKLNCPYILGR